MKILFLAHRFPYPPSRGDKIRAFHVIRHMSESRGDKVTVASLVRSKEEEEAARGIAPYCERAIIERVYQPVAVARMLTRLPTREPSSMGFFYSRGLERAIREELSRHTFDLVFVFCSSVAQYVETYQGAPKILDFADMDSQKWLAYGQESRFPLATGYYLEGLKLQLKEAELARAFPCTTVTTPAELRTLLGFNAGGYSDWFPNGVDTDHFKPPTTAPTDDTICFVGRMDYFPNQQAMLWFCDEVLPLVQAQRPGAKLMIVGADPPRSIRRLGERKGVTVTGSVPDVRPYLEKSRVSIAPLQIARGTQNKILETMATGIPTIASPMSAGGVDAVVGQHLLAATKPSEYANAILKVLSDETFREDMRKAARERMLTHHSWTAAMAKLDQIIETCLARFERRS